MELMILATKNSTPIIGQISVVMGWIMNGIYKFLDGLFGIQNLGLCIIIFSILIYLFMTPLQIKQQKVLKTEFSYAAGADEDPEEIQG